MELDQFRDVDVVIDRANYSFVQKQFVSQGDYKGRSLTVQVTDNGVVGEVAGLTLNLQWHNKASGLTDLSAFTVIDKASSVFRIEYPEHMMTPGEVVASIQVLQGGKSTFLKSFTLTVQQLAGQAVGIAQQAEFSALVAVLAEANKFQTEINKLGSEKADRTEVYSEIGKKSDKVYVDNMLSSIAQGGPRELFYSLAALKAKYPTGADGTYLVFDTTTSDGAHSYIWEKDISDWKDLGLYQSMYIQNKSITMEKIAEKSVGVEETNFAIRGVNLVRNITSNFVLSGNDEVIFKVGTGQVVIIPCEQNTNYHFYVSSDRTRFRIAGFNNYPKENEVGKMLYYTDAVTERNVNSLTYSYLVFYISNSATIPSQIQITKSSALLPYEKPRAILSSNNYEARFVGADSVCNVNFDTMKLTIRAEGMTLAYEDYLYTTSEMGSDVILDLNTVSNNLVILVFDVIERKFSLTNASTAYFDSKLFFVGQINKLLKTAYINGDYALSGKTVKQLTTDMVDRIIDSNAEFVGESSLVNVDYDKQMLIIGSGAILKYGSNRVGLNYAEIPFDTTSQTNIVYYSGGQVAITSLANIATKITKTTDFVIGYIRRNTREHFGLGFVSSSNDNNNAHYLLSDEFKATNSFIPYSKKHSDLYALYDGLLDSHKGYRNIFCIDEAGLNVYEYIFTMGELSQTLGTTYLKPKIYFTSAHSHEFASHASLFSFIKQMCESNDSVSKTLRFGFEVHVIPTLNPWGIDNNSRVTINGVDPNRNFPGGWTQGSAGTPTYGGDTPLSLIACKTLYDVMSGSNIAFAIDVHNAGLDSNNEASFWLGTNKEKIKPALTTSIFQNMQNYALNYNDGDINTTQYRIGENANGTVANEWCALGRNGVICESVWMFDGNHELAQKANVETLGTTVKNLLAVY